MVVFAFATMIAWFYLGKQAASYVVGALGLRAGRRQKFVEKIYPMLYAAAVFAGSVGRLDVVWTLSDIWNGLMAFPNLTALLFLSGQVMMPDWRGKRKI